MKMGRSILAVVVGGFVAAVVISGNEMINFVVYAPDDGKPFLERMREMKDNPQASKAWIESLPTSAMVTVLIAWQVGAFVGGGFAALIAGRWHLLHAGIIGALVLAGTILNFLNMKSDDIPHPDWMIVAGLLLPLPVSLLAGKIVSLLFPPSAGSIP